MFSMIFKKPVKLYSLFVLVSLIAYSPSFCAFQNMVGVRGLGMGSAFTALAKETSGLYWNPAGLGDLSQREVSGMYSKDSLDTGYLFVSYGQPLPEFGGIAFGWSRFSNSFEKTDTDENIIGSAGVSNDIVMAGISYYQQLPVSLGITGKFISERIDTFSLSGWAFDAGVLLEVDPLKLALVAENIFSSGLTGNSALGDSVKERLPAALRFGFAIFDEREIKSAGNQSSELHSQYSPVENDKMPTHDSIGIKTNFACDIVMPLDNPDKTYINPGVELWINDKLGFRSGIKAFRDFSSGLSLKFSSIRIDYAFVFSQNLENSHLFSTSVFF